MPRLAFYVSHHGYGHAARSGEIMAALPPDWEIDIVSAIPAEFFHRTLDRPFGHRSAELDAGCAMAGPWAVDAPATADRALALLSRRDELVAREADRLIRSGAQVVAVDAGWLPLAAAQAAGLPGVLTANFTWREI